ncbi:hypothetical protein IFR05_006506 [Cadophora sp. M221]|nr:hypothetical protein IFR05_006506 [Cadophora sp. M221]
MTPRHIRQQEKDAQRTAQEAKRAAKLERSTSKAQQKAAEKAKRVKAASQTPELHCPRGGFFHREPKSVMATWHHICPVAPYEGMVAARRAILTSTLLSKAEVTADHFVVEEDTLELSRYARVLVAATESQIHTWRTSPMGRGLEPKGCTLIRKDMSELPDSVTRCFHQRDVDLDLNSEETKFILLTRYQAKLFAAMEESNDTPSNFFLLRKSQNLYNLRCGEPPGRARRSGLGFRTSRLRRWRCLGSEGDDDCCTFE